jgi:CheY-like chemotaxis protein
MGRAVVETLFVGRDKCLAEYFAAEMRHRYGATVHLTQHTADALDLIDQHKLEAVFVDLQDCQPEEQWEDPLDVLRCLRLSPKNKKCITVVFTHKEELDILATARRAGADYFLIKPLVRPQLDRLMHVIHGVMAESRRLHQRTHISFPVLCATRQRQDVGASVNLSASGMLLSLQGKTDVREQEEVELVFPYGQKVSDPFVLHGRVARVEDGGNVAVAFQDMPRLQRDRLKAWVELALFCQPNRADGFPLPT